MSAVSPSRPARVFLLEPNARSLSGHYFHYSKAIAEAFQARGYAAECVFAREFQPSAAPGLTIHPLYDRHWAKADVQGPDLGRGRGFGYETMALLSRLGARPQDVAYLATIGCGEFLEWLEMLAHDGMAFAETGPELHLMLRCDPRIAQDNIAEYWSRATQAFAPAAVRNRVRLHADTAPLAERFSAILGVEVLTAPIPFDQAHLRRHLAEAPRPPGQRPMNVVYLGDARAEKGYAALPSAIGEVWEDLVASRRMRFTLQSNMNVAGGEPGVAAARARLQRLPRDMVSVLAEAQPPEAYYHHLHMADAVLVPYDAEQYRLRSSGICIEAAAAGKPMIITAASWMATLADRLAAVVIADVSELAEGLRRLEAGYDALAARARALQEEWIAWSSPEAFVDHLQGAGKQVTAEADRPQMLLVLDESAPGQKRYLKAAAETAAPYAELTALAISRERSGGRFKARLAADFPAHRLLVADGSTEQAMESGRWRVDRAPSSLDEVVESVCAAAISANDLALLRAQRFDLCILGGIEQAALIERLIEPPARLIALADTRRATAVSETGGEDRERLILEACDLVLYPNRMELDASGLPEQRKALAPPPCPHAPLDGTDFAWAFSLSALLEAAEPSGLAFHDWRGLLETIPQIDLVVHAENGPDDLAALEWFVRDVYRPHLWRQGLSLLVSGTGSAAPFLDGDAPIVRLGSVKRLRPVLAAARLAVIPSREPDDPWLTTALEMGKPLVMRQHARSGALAAYRHAAPDASSFAAETLNLARSRSARIAAATALRVASAATVPQNAWCEVLNTLGSMEPAPASTSPIASLPEEQPLVEWSPMIGAAMRALEAWAVGERVAPADRDLVRQVLRYPAQRELLIQAWNETMTGTTQPPHGVSVKLASAVRRAGLAGCRGDHLVALLGENAGADVATRIGGIGPEVTGMLLLSAEAPVVAVTVDEETSPTPTYVQIAGFRPMPTSQTVIKHARSFTSALEFGPKLCPALLQARLEPGQSLWVMQPLALELPPLYLESGKTPARVDLSFEGLGVSGWHGTEPAILVLGSDRGVAPKSINVTIEGRAAPTHPVGGFGAPAWVAEPPHSLSMAAGEPVVGSIGFDLHTLSPSGLADLPLSAFIMLRLRPVLRPSMLLRAAGARQSGGDGSGFPGP